MHELQFGAIADFACGTIHTGRATLELGATEYEELEALGARLGRARATSSRWPSRSPAAGWSRHERPRWPAEGAPPRRPRRTPSRLLASTAIVSILDDGRSIAEADAIYAPPVDAGDDRLRPPQLSVARRRVRASTSPSGAPDVLREAGARRSTRTGARSCAPPTAVSSTTRARSRRSSVGRCAACAPTTYGTTWRASPAPTTSARTTFATPTPARCSGSRGRTASAPSARRS